MADFFDGYLARIFTTSSAGKVLDGETDQQFVLVTASAAFLFLNMPYWLLLFPGIKYIFGICYDLFNLRLKEKIGEKRRKIVAACVMISLFMNLAFLVSEKASLMLYLITLLLLSYSFLADLFGALKIKSKE